MTAGGAYLWPVRNMWPFSRLYNSSWTGGVGRRPGVGLQTKVSGDEGERKGSAGIFKIMIMRFTTTVTLMTNDFHIMVVYIPRPDHDAICNKFRIIANKSEVKSVS